MIAKAGLAESYPFIKKWLASAIMFSFAVLAFQRWLALEHAFFLLLAFDNLIKSCAFALRLEPTEKSPLYQVIISYLSAALPLMYLPASDSISLELATVSELIMIGGFLIITLATIDLGMSIGISPAKRGPTVRTGIYNLFRHPMYTGHIVSEVALSIANPLNVLLLLVSTAAYILRMKWENKLVNN